MNANHPITGNRGVATSLIEAVLVIAIAAVLSSMAIIASIDRIEDARLTQAINDTQIIGVAIHSFMQDNLFPPAYQQGNATSATAPIFLVLQSAGQNATVDMSLNWPTDPTTMDRIENQLITNMPGGTGVPYPLFGQISYARTQGWNGPYIPSLPSSDPWGDKYLVNVQLLTPQGIQMATAPPSTFVLAPGQRPAVFVISAGPDRVLSTNFLQTASGFTAGGDDIVFRIQ